MFASRTLCFFAAILAAQHLLASAELKLCANKAREGDSCRSLEASTQEVRCVYVEDSVDCLLKLKAGSADFGVFTAEEALVVAQDSSDLQVVGEVRHKTRISESFDFQTVAVVRANHSDGINGLRGKNYCHPGFSRAQYWTDPVLKALEKQIIKTSALACEANKTVVESETNALSQFFARGCRPGSWTINTYMDNKLKTNYRNLCSLCDNPTECAYETQTIGSHFAALRCLTQRGGDVVYNALSTTRNYFLNQTSTGFGNQNAADYSFLCPDGTKQPLTAMEPCTWIKQPWTSLIAPSRIANTVNGRLKDLYPDAATPRGLVPWKDRLRDILTGDSGALLVSSTQSVSAYVTRGRSLTEAPNRCGQDIKWCTTSAEEKNKCQILAIAGRTHGIVPNIMCPVSAANVTECLKFVNQSDADIAVISTNEGFVARRAHNLAPLMYVESERTGNYYGVIVVSANSTARSIKQLKGGRACFPSFNGLGWLMFMETARKAGELPSNACPAGQKTLEFFGEACAPGVNDRNINIANVTVPDTVCAACIRGGLGGTCESSTSNPFFGELGALRCLNSGAGHAAFLDFNALTKILETPRSGTQDASITASNLRVLCKDGTLSEIGNLNLDNCAQIQVIGNEVVTRKLQNKARSRDIQFALEEMDDWFGSVRPRSLIKLFGMFNNASDVLLPSTGVDIINIYSTEGSFANNYAALHNQLQHCSAGSRILTGLTVILTSLLCLAIRH